MTGRPDIALFKRWGRSLIDVDKLLMTDECNYDQTPVVQKVDNTIHRIVIYPVDSSIQLLNNWAQPLVRHQSVRLQKCWMKPVLVLAPSQPTAHCFALAYSIITLAHRLLSKRENACSLTEERPVTMHTHTGCKSHFHVILGWYFSSNRFGADLRVCFHWRYSWK